MASWMSTFIKDMKVKVGFSGYLSENAQTVISSRDHNLDGPPRTEQLSYDYYPSRLPSPELQLLFRYILQMRNISASHNLMGMTGRLLYMEDLAFESGSFSPYLEMDMSKAGYACITASLGERPWPPEEGYSFVCWFQYKNLNLQGTAHPTKRCLRLFSIWSTDIEKVFHEEVYLEEDGVLVVSTNNIISVSCSNLEIEEGEWYHLAVVCSKRKSLAGEDIGRSVAFYINGKLKHTGELASVSIISKKNLQMTIGIPAKFARVNNLSWKIRSCYLFNEKLSADCVCFMYILGGGYKLLLQGSGAFHFMGAEGGARVLGDRISVLNSRSDTEIGRSDSAGIPERLDAEGTDTVWSFEMLRKVWLELHEKRLICAFNAARIEAMQRAKTLRLLNLIDPVSVSASPNGVPQFGHLHGDVSICRRCVTGNVTRPVSEIAVVLAFVEAAETTDMLRIALELLAFALKQNLRNAKEMKSCNGYHLLSLFLRRRMLLFDSQCLEILFKISLLVDSSKPKDNQTSFQSSTLMLQEELSLEDDHKSLNDVLERDNARTSICGGISDADAVEHVLLDWTIWVTAPVPIQLEIVNFLENIVSVYEYRDHNLTVLRGRNIVHLLLVTLHREDVEVLILEKLVILLSVFLEDKLIDTELEDMTRFVVSTFDPAELARPQQIMRETKSKHVTLRNILLEALIDLQVTIPLERLVEQWHSVVSSKLITFFLDEGVHPTTMVWIITLLGLCLTSSPIFSLRFEKSGGYQALVRVLPRFYDYLDLYYTLFCLIIGKPIYPKLPEVSIQDFEELMPSEGGSPELKFTGLLASIIAMAKSSFSQSTDRSTDEAAKTTSSQAVIIANENTDAIEEVFHSTLARRASFRELLVWHPSASNATAILRFMANLAKLWPSFSYVCGQAEFLESCVDLYFSIVRAFMSLQLGRESNAATTFIQSSLLLDGSDEIPKANVSSLSSENIRFSVNSEFLLAIDNLGYGADSGSAGATAVLDLVAEVLSHILIQQANAVPLLEDILGSVPLNFDSGSVLTFHSLCLDRVMNSLERRLIQDDDRNGHKLDKHSLWLNIGSFCNLVVDCVYLGVFPKPACVMRVLEFCFTMLHSAKKDGQMDDSSSSWTGILSVLKGSRPGDDILKSANRIILYCLLPSFLASIRGAQGETLSPSVEEISIDICVVLELVYGHREVVFHPSNVDADLYCSLCINLLSLLSDHRSEARKVSVIILKYLLAHRRAALENVFISEPMQLKQYDLLNGGLDRLLTEDISTFMDWFQSSEDDIHQGLQQFAGIKWSQYIFESSIFREERLHYMEDRRSRKMGKKVEDASRDDHVYWNEYMGKRINLNSVRSAVRAELELAQEKKFESVLYAEREWRTHLQRFGHKHEFELGSTSAWEDYWPLA